MAKKAGRPPKVGAPENVKAVCLRCSKEFSQNHKDNRICRCCKKARVFKYDN